MTPLPKLDCPECAGLAAENERLREALRTSDEALKYAHQSEEVLSADKDRLTAALRSIAYLRPAGGLDTARGLRPIIKKIERTALDALSEQEGK